MTDHEFLLEISNIVRTNVTMTTLKKSRILK